KVQLVTMLSAGTIKQRRKLFIFRKRENRGGHVLRKTLENKAFSKNMSSACPLRSSCICKEDNGIHHDGTTDTTKQNDRFSFIVHLCVVTRSHALRGNEKTRNWLAT